MRSNELHPYESVGFGSELGFHDIEILQNERGAPQDFSTTDRYAAMPGGLVRAEWRTPVREWSDFGGRPCVRRAAAVWHLPEGEFTYADFTFEPNETDYNV